MAKGHVVSIVPEQCRAARGWLDWSANKLAIKAGVAVSTVRDFEKGRRIPATPTLVSICQVLEREGVWFFPDGVSVKRSMSR
jgi:transcriptional regulator with XRE-family HTH domain